MKKSISFLAIIFLLFFSFSCSDDDEINDGAAVSPNLEIENFIWKGLNLFYLWQEEVANLSDDRFDTQQELEEFLENSESPENLFYDLLYDYPNQDKYSWIVDDYVALEEQLQQGITGSNGVEFGLVYESGSNTDVFGYVRYIVTGSDASSKNIKRGDIIHAVNGTPLTVSNYRQLLFETESYTLNLADYNNGNPTDNGESVSLTKLELQENPVHIVNTVEDSGKKIGYLMYNSFTSAFDNQLNNAFATLKSEAVTDLVLDLRYNSGGSVRTAIYLGGMITGQFDGQLFTQEKWNSKWQAYFEENEPEYLINNFVNQLSTGESLNSLNLENIVILTTGSTASASELIINSLNPYINVTTVGIKTEGKYVASVTLYDSESYGKEGANPDHNYAMQPIVLEEANKIGENDKDGFDPDIPNPEDFGNMGVLGDPTEPMFARAIQFITLGSKIDLRKSNIIEHIDLTNSKRESLTGSNMYVDKEFPFLK